MLGAGDNGRRPTQRWGVLDSHSFTVKLRRNGAKRDAGWGAAKF
jgi:hypothetical protein